MDATSALELARAAMQAKVSNQQFSVTWRGGGSSLITGQQSLADTLQMRLATVRCYLSTGHGKFTRQMTNPLTGEPDLVTVERIPEPAKPKAKRGRPPSKATLYRRAMEAEQLAEQAADAAERLPKSKR